MPAIPVLRRQRQEDLEFKDSLSYKSEIHSNTVSKNKTKTEREPLLLLAETFSISQNLNFLSIKCL
jgi:hypothetical protein